MRESRIDSHKHKKCHTESIFSAWHKMIQDITKYFPIHTGRNYQTIPLTSVGLVL